MTITADTRTALKHVAGYCEQIAADGILPSLVWFAETASFLRSLEAAANDPPWMPITTAPKDGTRVDIWAKCWRAFDDSFTFQRFPSCSWMKGDSMTNRQAYWLSLDTGWCPTHWMPLPDPPQASEGEA